MTGIVMVVTDVETCGQIWNGHDIRSAVARERVGNKKDSDQKEMKSVPRVGCLYAHVQRESQQPRYKLNRGVP